MIFINVSEAPVLYIFSNILRKIDNLDHNAFTLFKDLASYAIHYTELNWFKSHPAEFNANMTQNQIKASIINRICCLHGM